MSTNETPNEETELQPIHQAVASDSVNIGHNGDAVGDYFEFEFEGQIINLKLLSRGNQPKNTTSPDVSITSQSDHEQLKLPQDDPEITQKMSASMEKREKIFNLMPDC